MTGATEDWEIPPEARPDPAHCSYDLAGALQAAVAVRTIVPEDAFTASTLGTERRGNGMVIEGGIVLTIGYLITEAETIWLTFADGRTVEGHALAYDQETGFGLVQPLARLDMDGLALGSSRELEVGGAAVIAAAGGLNRSLAARLVGRQEFAGYWEYVLEEALFTAPAHPHWGGTGLIGASGELIGIGSLQLEAAGSTGTAMPINMVVPIDILKPILGELKAHGRRNRPARPWLGVYCTGMEDKVVVMGVAGKGPARDRGMETGDIILRVAGTPVGSLAGFYRRVWSLGDAGVEVPLTVHRDGRTLELRLRSGDRNDYLKRPRLH
ncbi:MAG: S1C family serine protease [Hyphomicrobiales bacterium]